MTNQVNKYSNIIIFGFKLGLKDLILLFKAYNVLAIKSLNVFIAILLKLFYKVFFNRSTPTIYNKGYRRKP